MVSKRRLDYGFSGYRIPPVPRAPRSARRRSSRKKLVEDSQICAFELLAAVAGKLLQESESSASSNVAEGLDQLGTGQDSIKQEMHEDDKVLRSECLDQGSCVESAFMPELVAQDDKCKLTSEELPNADNDSVLERASTFMSSDLPEEVKCDKMLGTFENNNAIGRFPGKVEGGSSQTGNVDFGKTENGCERQLDDESKQTQDLTVADTCNAKEMEKNVNNDVLINSDSSVQLPLYRDPLPIASFGKHRNDVKLDVRDDDENSFGCNKLSTKLKAFRPQPRIGYRRIRKMLTSRHWKVAPKLKDSELSKTNDGMKPFYHGKKHLYRRERHQHEFPSKRRKLFNHSFAVAYDEEASSESISNSPDKGNKGGNNCSAVILHRASAPLPSVKSLQRSKDCKVKFSIKSFRVPELYIEVPENATVGSLKRTVMEAVTTILGGGLRVGVVLQGKKVRDDNRTLQQAGISHNGNLDTLGFTLEPNFTQVPPSLPTKDAPISLSCDANQQLSRSPTSPHLDSGFVNASFDPPVTKVENHVDSNDEMVHSPRIHIGELTDEAAEDSKALVPVPALNAEALAVVPMCQKNKRSEFSQRRTRRPFSVTEVEALVEAVEKLGTGRWRDVKMRAFDNADHRTYVDLKDKWKTLVHTASISPQQRRGEPVPQELLDRVLSAHAYWSQHQTKQHAKHHVEPLRIADAQVQKVGA